MSVYTIAGANMAAVFVGAGMTNGIGVRAAIASGDPSYEEMFPGIPVAGSSRGAMRMFEMSGAGPVYSNGPGSIRGGARQGELSEIDTKVNKIIQFMARSTVVPPQDVFQNLGDIIGADRNSFMRIAELVFFGSSSMKDDLDPNLTKKFMDALNVHLPRMRQPFARAFMKQAFVCYRQRGRIDTKLRAVMRGIVEDKPEWAAEVVGMLKDRGEFANDFRTKVASILDISLRDPVVVDWEEGER